MDRLNYFNPYQSKGGQHEDQLTRVYFALLKHSFHTFFMFIEYMKNSCRNTLNEEPISILNYLEEGWDIDVQKDNPSIKTNYLLSVLITDNIIENSAKVEPCDRNARYDGIITFGSNLTIIIENKPRSGCVWFEQLSPSRHNLADDTIVYEGSVILKWSEIIKQLNQTLSICTLNGTEKMLIEDFLSFIDDNFPHLNPFENLQLCKNNHELIQRRILNILKSIVVDEDRVKYHKGWGYYIEINLPQIQKIGLILRSDDDGWRLELSLFFGDSQRQAIAFYNSNPQISQIKNNGWWIFPNFHVSFMTTNLLWFGADNVDVENYIEYWTNNTTKIYQHKKVDVENLLQELDEKDIITYTSDNKEQMQDKFHKTAMSTLNICPGLGVLFLIYSQEAQSLDRNSKLEVLIIEKIIEGLQIVGVSAEVLNLQRFK